jgi:hypothetical protein
MRIRAVERARGAPIAVLLALVCAGLLPACSSKPKPEPSLASRPPSPAPTVSTRPRLAAVARAYAGDGFAIWPEDTYEAAVASSNAPDTDSWRITAGSTAERFAADVLDWGRVTTKTMHSDADTTRISVSERGSRETLELLLREEPPGWWSVINVLPRGEYFPPMTVRGGRASFTVELEGEAVSAEVTLGYGGHERSLRVDLAGKVVIDLGFRPASSGHFLVLYRDGNGRTVSALGTTLPAGDFAAG